MIIAELRRRASRLGKLLRDNARKPWNADLAREVLSFLEYFNMARGEGFDHSHMRFWVMVLGAIEPERQVPLDDSKISAALENISHRIADYVAVQGTNGGFELTIAMCDVLKITHHPKL